MFTVGALGEYVTWDRASRNGTALSGTMAQERQDRQRDPNQRPHGCSSLSEKMQYAVQIDGIWHDLLQSLEKTRDAMSPSSVQVDGEMSPEFARLDTCDSHMTKKWRGTAPPGACRAQAREAMREE
jgi:hypothetical protein